MNICSDINYSSIIIIMRELLNLIFSNIYSLIILHKKMIEIWRCYYKRYPKIRNSKYYNKVIES